MAGITALGTTFNLPNFHGELISLTPSETPFLTACGGLNAGGGQTTAPEFEWQGYDLRAPGLNVALEGQVAPTGVGRVRQNITNVAEIHQSKVGVSYSKQASTGQFAGANVAGTNPVGDELGFQVTTELAQMGRDVNWSFLNGQFAKPTDNATPRKTRGIISAASTKRYLGSNAATGASSATTSITPTAAHSLSVGDRVVFTATGAMTNIVPGQVYFVQAVATTVSFSVAATSGGAAIALGTSAANIDYHSTLATDLTEALFSTWIQDTYDAGGMRGGNNVFVVNSTAKRAITRFFANLYKKADPLVNGNSVGGVNVQTVETDFGPIGIMLDPMMPKDGVLLAQMDQVKPVFLNIPGKGVFFVEELAKTGATDDSQLYGEVGLDYGSPIAHGYLGGVSQVL